jgi:hypothetical protein
MADLSSFSSSYEDAQEKFLDAAGAHAAHERHPAEKGPSGEALYLDVAALGPQDASRVLAVGCGTHGIEGYPGSAALTHWMRSGGAKRLPPDTAVVFPQGSAGYARARDWWGERAVNRDGVTHKALAVYKGLLVDAFEAMLPEQSSDILERRVRGISSS